MARVVTKKYKIAVGICGPTILYSDVIKAHNREEAVEKFIADSEGKYSESDKEMLLQHIHEIAAHKLTTDESVKTSMKDYDLSNVSVGDQVAFICVRRNEQGFRRYSIQKGSIQSFTASSAMIYCEDLEKSFRLGETSGRYTGNQNTEYRLKKVALIKEFRIASNDANPTDALGQELSLGDTVAYMADIYQDSCAGFIKGTITKISAKFVEMDGSKKKTHDRVVIIHHAK